MLGSATRLPLKTMPSDIMRKLLACGMCRDRYQPRHIFSTIVLVTAASTEFLDSEETGDNRPTDECYKQQ